MTICTTGSPSDRRSPSGATTCFSVYADADPGLMPRILEIFAKRGLVPTQWHSRVGGRDGTLTIDLQMRGLNSQAATAIASEMRVVWGVSRVLAAETRIL